MQALKYAETRGWRASAVLWTPVLAALALILSGCATPVGVKRVDIQTAYDIQTVSALSAERPSEPSKTVLRRLGLMDRFNAEPARVLAELHRGLSREDDADRLFALAELSFLHGDRANDRAYFLASTERGAAGPRNPQAAVRDAAGEPG